MAWDFIALNFGLASCCLWFWTALLQFQVDHEKPSFSRAIVPFLMFIPGLALESHGWFSSDWKHGPKTEPTSLIERSLLLLSFPAYCDVTFWLSMVSSARFLRDLWFKLPSRSSCETPYFEWHIKISSAKNQLEGHDLPECRFKILDLYNGDHQVWVVDWRMYMVNLMLKFKQSAWYQ